MDVLNVLESQLILDPRGLKRTLLYGIIQLNFCRINSKSTLSSRSFIVHCIAGLIVLDDRDVQLIMLSITVQLLCCYAGRYSYMIDNIMLLITGTLHQRQISELRSKFHPFGRFEELESSNIASTPADLYNAILVDTPLGEHNTLTNKSYVVLAAPYFKECVSEQDLDELHIEIIRNTLFKTYLEDFYKFCQKMGGATAEVMGMILKVSMLC